MAGIISLKERTESAKRLVEIHKKLSKGKLIKLILLPDDFIDLLNDGASGICLNKPCIEKGNMHRHQANYNGVLIEAYTKNEIGDIYDY